MTAYGIDFGTTNCVVAQSNARRARVLAPDAGGRDSDWNFTSFHCLVPSVFGLEPTETGRELFGWAAKLRSVEPIEAVKQIIAEREHLQLGDRTWTTEQVATALFRVLREGVRADAGRLDEAVVTVPANSPGRARLQTRVAAGNAGIGVAALLNEPTAAALASLNNSLMLAGFWCTTSAAEPWT